MKTKYLFAALIFLGATPAAPQTPERAVTAEVTVNAAVAEVWKAWTTGEGIKSFFAPGCKIELRVFGAFEIYFNPDGPPGQRGAEGNMILAIQPHKMLSFTWDAPPTLSNVRQQRTSVVLRFNDLGNNQTKVTLTQIGFGEGEEWDKAFEYFSHAWQEVVFKHLKDRFETGPIGWNK